MRPNMCHTMSCPAHTGPPLSVADIREDDQRLEPIAHYTGDDPVLRICRDFTHWARRGTE